jgi:hypothetical protein
MAITPIVNESQLDAWVRANASVAQGKIVELIWRLVCASCPKPTHRRFPLGDSIGQHGADGELETAVGFPPFIPDGKSHWEIGTNLDARSKANGDYSNATAATPEAVRQKTTFIFATPLSGRRDWKDTWKADGIETWVKEKRGLREWQDVIVLDGTQLTDWITQFPGVGHWLGTLLDQLPDDFDTAESHWHIIKNHGSPPPLIPDLFLIGRESAKDKLRRIIVEQTDRQLRLDTKYPRQPTDFVSAFVASLPEEERYDHQNRILIFSSEETWKKACTLNGSHVFVANFDLDTDHGPQLIQRAASRGHSIIYSGPRGGIPHGNACELVGPRAHEVKDALIKAGYSEERARNLVNRVGNDLNALLRLLTGLSAMPEWATQSEACDIAIAQLLGQWDDEREGDQAVAGDLSGNAYGEWIAKIQKAASAKAAPLECFNGRWKFTARYEAWVYLSPLVGADVLERFQRLAITVLSEADPELDLPKEQRFAASIHGRPRHYSKGVRQGMAETLALLGTYGDALTACATGRPKAVAWNVVSTLLTGVDASRWASLNDVLPLIAEASPDAFLSAVGGASEKPDEPFSGVFSQEDGGVMGRTYSSGLLWALEALAWSPEYLSRVCGVLANLTAVDPGGQYANRPSNSLVTILLPWLPQTAADAKARYAAMHGVVRNQPEVAWKVLLGLLPHHHGTSSPTHKPKWRDFIPEGWEDGVTNAERWADESHYAFLALSLAGNDPDRLAKLVQFYFYLSPEYQAAYQSKLLSDQVLSLPEEVRLELWTALIQKTSNHRKYADSPAWAVREDQLEELESAADKIKPVAPEVRHKRLFAGYDSDLYEKAGDWDEQRKHLNERRVDAVGEILDRGGFDNLLSFARSAAAPNEVGGCFGAISKRADDFCVLPGMLSAENDADVRFAKGYAWSRFRDGVWAWVDGLDKSSWGPVAKGILFAIFPFTNETWIRVMLELGADEEEYWKRAWAVPNRDNLDRIDWAIGKLIEYHRSDAAIDCICMLDKKDSQILELGLRALEAFTEKNRIDAHDIGELFALLQADPTQDEGRLAQMEIKFLGLLDSFGRTLPKTLHRQLSEQPDFFCEVTQLLYRAKSEVDNHKDDKESTLPTPKPKLDEAKANSAERAYKLLHDWCYPPGRQRDDSFDAVKLKAWYDTVKAKCVQNEREEVAAHHIGEVLYYAPRDADGLWIEPVCELLDTKDGEAVRSGLRMKIFNLRGVHGFTNGKDETELAEKWDKMAAFAEAKGFTRLGGTLRGLGKTYRDDAKRSITLHGGGME